MCNYGSQWSQKIELSKYKICVEQIWKLCGFQSEHYIRLQMSDNNGAALESNLFQTAFWCEMRLKNYIRHLRSVQIYKLWQNWHLWVCFHRMEMCLTAELTTHWLRCCVATIKKVWQNQHHHHRRRRHYHYHHHHQIKEARFVISASHIQARLVLWIPSFNKIVQL